MSARSLRWTIAALIAGASPAALALGLGDIHLHSALNAPLSADIDLIGATPDDLSSLKAQLASRDTFASNGLDYPAFLSSLAFSVRHTPDGRDVVEVRSSQAISEPFVTLLVELNWARGRVAHEYTVLLDPPLYAPGQASRSAANADVATPRAGGGNRGGDIRRDAPETATVTPESTPATSATAAASSASTPARGGPSAQAPAQAQAQAQAPGRAQSDRSSAGQGAAGGTYTVRRGESLSSISEQHASGSPSSWRRWMVAIYNTNPGAFDGNMNALRAGSVLRLPDEAQVAAIKPEDAATEVHRQFAAWRAGGGTASAQTRSQAQTQSQTQGQTQAQAGKSTEADAGRLRLVTPNSPRPQAAAGGSGSGSGTGQEIQQLQAQLAESQRLVQVQQAELARLQAQLAASQSAGRGPGPNVGPNASPNPGPNANPSVAPNANQAASQNAGQNAGQNVGQNVGKNTNPGANQEAAKPPVEAPAATSAPVAAVAPPVPATPATSAPAAAEAATSAPAAVARPPASSAPVRRRPNSVPVAVPQHGLGAEALDLLKQYWWALAALAAAVAAWGGARVWRQRQQARLDASLGELTAAPAVVAPSAAQAESPAQSEPEVVEEPALRARSGGGAENRPAPSVPHVSGDDSMGAGAGAIAPATVDQGDVLAEADFHMAYGLYDQAADLIRNAITRQPKRRDLRLKLLEIFFVWGVKDKFLEVAHELAQTRDQGSAGEWEKILIMGKQLAPEDGLFATGGVSSASVGKVDLDFDEGPVTGLHFIDGLTPGASNLPFDDANAKVDLDIGTALSNDDHDATGENFDDSASNVINTVQLPEARSNTLDTGRAAPQRHAPGALDEFDVDGHTVERPVAEEDQRGRVHAAFEQAPKIEQTSEMAFDDLGLDLGTLDQTSSDAPTLVAGLDERSRQILARAADKNKLDEVEEEEPMVVADVDVSATGNLQALNAADLDFDFNFGDDLQQGNSAPVDGNPVSSQGLDQGDRGQAGRSSGLSNDTQQLNNEDLVRSFDMEDQATMSEVGTKLDLARAYMDMGDPEGARNILEEVVNEGSQEQKQEAKRLIGSLPG